MSSAPRVPLIEVKDPIPEPAKAKETYLPSWPTTTPSQIVNAQTHDAAVAAVNEVIVQAASDRGVGHLTNRLPDGDEREKRQDSNRRKTKAVMKRLWPSKGGKNGKRLKTLFSGQWADVPLEEFLAFAADAGFEGVELACWHFDMQRALVDDAYVGWIKALFEKYGLKLVAISTHLVGQCVLDNIDERHQAIVPAYIWGDGNRYGVNLRAAQEVMDTVLVAQRLGVKVINGFTGSSIWHMVYDFPPAPKGAFQAGFDLLAERWNPILDVFGDRGIVFALEVHPTEIAYDVITFERSLKALDYRPEFGMNYDPSHLIWQGMDPVELIRRFPDRVYHVHMKDALVRQGNYRSVLGSYLSFGDEERGFDFVSLGRGDVNFNDVIRALNTVGYLGPLSNEWEDSGMERTEGAREASKFITATDFSKSDRRMDQAFATPA